MFKTLDLNARDGYTVLYHMVSQLHPHLYGKKDVVKPSFEGDIWRFVKNVRIYHRLRNLPDDMATFDDFTHDVFLTPSNMTTLKANSTILPMVLITSQSSVTFYLSRLEQLHPLLLFLTNFGFRIII